MLDWINGNLEPCPGQNLDLHHVADSWLSRSTRAERRALGDKSPADVLRELLPVEGREIIGYRFKSMPVTPTIASVGTWRRPLHRSRTEV